MSKFNSAYFQAQILKNQIAADVSVANNTRINEDTAASLATTVTGITVKVTTGDHNAAASANGLYLISTGNTKLYVSAALTWGLAPTGKYVFDASSNATYAGRAYDITTNVALADGQRITSGRFQSTNNTVLYTCAAGGLVTVVSAGRYFNHASAPTALLNVASGVTDGTYTVISNTPGARQFVDTTPDSYFYYDSVNSVWSLLPFA